MRQTASQMIVIELPGPPVAKGRPRFSRRTGTAYTPAATRAYESRLRAVALDAMKGRAILTGPLEVTLFAYMPIPESWSHRKRQLAQLGAIRPTSRPDLENCYKCLDSFNSFRDKRTKIKVPVLWADDALVVDAHIHKFYSDKPRLVVIVQELQQMKIND